MTDSFNRKITYLRLSVTERCSEKCIYCSKSEGKCPKESELSAESFVKIARACALIGISKVRLTGGEPLLRRDFIQIVSGISSLNTYKDISLTTNAQLLKEQAHALKKAGINRCNISLDSLRDEAYNEMTGGDLQKVFRGIKAAFQERMTPVRLNTVLIKGKNDLEIDSFIELARKYPVDVRFIELMPMGDASFEGISNEKILADRPYLKPVELTEDYSGPAKYYSSSGFAGKVGFISPISHSFCESCNRIRVTSDGFIRPCLGDTAEYSLKEALTGSTEDLARLIFDIIRKKPQRNSFSDSFQTNRKMNQIGG
ncbi:MAG: GTP 3',8-cyclase MoaA [Acutalibacteraceae bacterium]